MAEASKVMEVRSRKLGIIDRGADWTNNLKKIK
jgi:hypothetical protein